MSKKLPIAIAQSLITADVQANGRHIRDLMAQAGQAGARLIHFPEAALSGYVKAQIRSWNEVDWAALRKELLLTMEQAKRLGIWCVVGCNHKLTPPNRPHNSIFVISDRGELATRYDKRFCSHSEISDWYSPGRLPVLFEVEGFRFGCALCIEIQFAEVFDEYERLDVDCVLFSAYSEDPLFRLKAQSYAGINCYWISVSAPAQCAAGLQSGLVGPHGHFLSVNDAKESACIQIVELDRSNRDLQVALTKARPWRRKAKSGGIYQPGPIGDVRSEDPTCL